MDPPRREPAPGTLGPYRSGVSTDLGAHLVTHRVGSTTLFRDATLGAVFLLSALIASSCALAIVATGSIGGLMFGAVGLALGYVAVTLLRDAWAYLRLRIEQHERGLVFIQGGEERTLPWSALKEVLPWQRAAYVELIDRDGQSFALPPRLDDRGHLLMQAARVAMGDECERVLTQIRAGKSHEIAAVFFSSAGLEWDTTGQRANPSGTLRWPHVRDVRVEWPELQLTLFAGRTYRFELPSMKRWVLFLALVESLRPRER